MMPKLICKCGYGHDLSPIPDDGWVTVLDKNYEKVLKAETKREKLGKSSANPEVFERLLKEERFVVESTGLLYECPECKRIMWKKPGNTEYTTFVLEKHEI